VGGGGREHALCYALRKSAGVAEVYCAPGNPGIAELADCLPVSAGEIVELADLAEKLGIDLTVVGPELPLSLGIVDEFAKRDLPIFGPTRLATQIESSKVFAKEFCHRHGIPTAKAHVCGSAKEAHAAIKKLGYPVVLKADGLAGGKGVLRPSRGKTPSARSPSSSRVGSSVRRATASWSRSSSPAAKPPSSRSATGRPSFRFPRPATTRRSTRETAVPTRGGWGGTPRREWTPPRPRGS